MFFSLSKIIWALVDPTNLLLLSLVLMGLTAFSRRPSWQRFSRRLLGVTVTVALLVSVLPFDRWLLLPLENRFPQMTALPDDVQGIVVAGGVINPYVSHQRGVVSIGGAVERVFALATLAKRYPNATLIYSAGSGSLSQQVLKEADFIPPLFEQLGIPASRVILENQSRNTVENAVLSKQIPGVATDGQWIVVTSAFHMPRTMGAFRQAGWHVLAYPTDYAYPPEISKGWSFSFSDGLRVLTRSMHEWLGLSFYWLTGRTNALFPAP